MSKKQSKITKAKEIFSIDLSDFKNDLKLKRDALNTIDYQKIVTRAEAKNFPNGFMIVLHTKNGRQDMEQAFKLSGPDESIDGKTIKGKIDDAINEFQDRFYEMLESSNIDESEIEKTDSTRLFMPQNIKSVRIRFIYPYAK